MKTLIARLRREAAERAAYRRIRDEIASLPREVAAELGLYPQDAEHLARQAVWG